MSSIVAEHSRVIAAFDEPTLSQLRGNLAEPCAPAFTPLTYNQMVVEQDAETDRIFRALADATRRDIVRRTIAGEQSVSALAAEYEMSFAAVQKHVAVLEAAELIVKRAEGRERLVRANPLVIVRARTLLDRYEQLWRARIDRLDDLLSEDDTTDSTTTDTTKGD